MYSISDNPPPAEPRSAAVPGIAAPSGNLPATQYDSLFSAAEREHGLPAGLLKSVAAAESSFNPNAVSPKGAQGLMQFMPDTAKRFGIDPRDPAQAISAAAKYLKSNFEMLGDWSHAVAGYNWGEGRVKRMLAGERLSPPPETKDYVKKVIDKLGLAAPAAPETAPTNDRGADIGVSADGRIYANGQVFDSKDYGKAIAAYRGGAFTAPGAGTLPEGFRQPNPGEVEAYFQRIVPSSSSGKSLTAGIENLKAGWNEIIGAGRQLLGTPMTQNTSAQAADVNKRYAGQLGALNEFPQEWDAAQGAGGVAQYAYGKVLESLPFMVEAIASGLVGAGVRMAATQGAKAAAVNAAKNAAEQAAAQGLAQAEIHAAADAAMKQVFTGMTTVAQRNAPQIAMVLGTYPSAAGDILGNQREQAEVYGPGSAAALAAPYAALNLLGGGAQAVRAMTGEALHGAVAGGRGIPGRLARAGTVGATTAIEESIGETGQETLNQAGRMAVDPRVSFTDPEAMARYRESAIAGAVVGGAFGGVAGGATRAQAMQPVDLMGGSPPAPAAAPVTPLAPPPPAPQPVMASIPEPSPLPLNDWKRPMTGGTAPLVPTGNMDMRPDAGSPWTGMRRPLVAPDQARAMGATQGAYEPVTASLPIQRVRPQVQAPGSESDVQFVPGGVPDQTNALGERYSPAVPSVAGGKTQAGPATNTATAEQRAFVGPGDPVMVKPRVSTTSVRAQRVPRHRLRPPTEAEEMARNAPVETTGNTVVDTPTVFLTRGEQVKALAAAKAEAGEFAFLPTKRAPRGAGGSSATVSTALRARAAKKAAAPAPSAEAAPAPKVEAPEAAASPQPPEEKRENAFSETPEALAEMEKQLDEKFPSVAHKAPPEPSEREKKRATGNVEAAKKLSEDVATDGVLTGLVQQFRSLSTRLRGAGDYLSKSKKPEMKGQRAPQRGGVDRIARDARTRGAVREDILNRLDKLAEQHGVAGVDAMFAYRKKNNLEAKAKKGEADVMVGLSNIWRLHRDGYFARGSYGFSRIGDESIRSRYEEGAIGAQLQEWWDGKNRAPWQKKDSKEPSPTGMRALALYMRFHARSDLEGILGDAMYRIFNKHNADFDLLVVKGPVTVRGLGTVNGAFLKAGTKVTHAGGETTTTKPTLLFDSSKLSAETFVHEMLHAATVRALLLDAKLRAGFKPILDALLKSDAGKNVGAQQIIETIRALKDADKQIIELVAYAFTHKALQVHMKTITMAPPASGRVPFSIKDAFGWFVNMVKLAVGAHGAKYSAMQRFIEQGATALQAAEEVGVGNTKVSVGVQTYRVGSRVVVDGETHTVTDTKNRQALGYDELTLDNGEKVRSVDVEMAPPRGPRQGALDLAHAVLAEPAHTLSLNPITAVEKAFKFAIETLLPFYKDGKFETFVKEQGKAAQKRIIANDSLRVYGKWAHGWLDKWGIPEELRTVLDMGRRKAHNAGQESFTFWSVLKGFTDEEQKFAHAYFKADGKVDTTGLNPERKVFLENMNTSLKDILARANAQKVLPTGLEEANITELINWIEKSTAKLAFGLKMSNDSRPVGIKPPAVKNSAVLGDAKEYHRGEIVTNTTVKADPAYVYVPVGASLADVEKQFGFKVLNLDTEHTYRPIEKRGNTTTMWAANTYAEGRTKMKVATWTDALVYTIHNILHDTAVSEFANDMIDVSNSNKDGSLVYDSEEALEKDVGKRFVINDTKHPRDREHARTPGYWVRLGEGYGNLSNKYVPATIYTTLTDMSDNAEYFPGYDKVLNFWKKTKTAYSPATHFNNIASSFVMMYLNDIPGSALAKAWKTFTLGRVWQDDGEFKANTPEEAAARTEWKRFAQSGALVASFNTAEISDDLAKRINAAIDKEQGLDSAKSLTRVLHAIEQTKAAQFVGKADKFAANWYGNEDNVFRMAAFFEGERRGMDESAAGEFAANSMINYSIDARYVNTLRKTILPFIAWPYRMVPMMLHTALFKPWKLLTMMTTLYTLNALSYAITGDDEDEERKHLPEYMRGSLFMLPGAPQALKMPFSIGDNPVYWNVSNFMPLGNFAEGGRSGLFGIQGWPQGLMPGGPLTAVAEIALNKSLFTDTPIWKPTDSGAESFGKSMKAGWQAFAPNLPLVSPRVNEKLEDLWREKHGLTGSVADWTPVLLSMVGPKLVPLDAAEREAQTGVAVSAIVRDYQNAMRKAARDENRYGNPDMDKVHEAQVDLVARVLKRIQKVKGEEE